MNKEYYLNMLIRCVSQFSGLLIEEYRFYPDFLDFLAMELQIIGQEEEEENYEDYLFNRFECLLLFYMLN